MLEWKVRFGGDWGSCAWRLYILCKIYAWKWSKNESLSTLKNYADSAYFYAMCLKTYLIFIVDSRLLIVYLYDILVMYISVY